MKIVLHHRVSGDTAARTRRAIPDGWSLAVVDPADRDGFTRELADADVLWHVLTPVGATDIAGAARLKLIHKFGVGTDTIDLDATRQSGIAVCNMPGVNRRAVAEMTLGLMLAAVRRIRELDELTRDGHGWSADPALFDHVGEIGGRTIGFLGYGQIPQSLVLALEALGAQVIYHRRSGPAIENAGSYVEFDELIARSDILSLHLPLTPQTNRIIDEATLRAMKRGSVLVNTGRGALVDDAALVAALRSGQLAAAGLDVFADSPLPTSHPLLELPNVTVTPHVAWLTPQTWARCLDRALDTTRQLLANQPLTDRVC